jgi:hypothetical protein
MAVLEEIIQNFKVWKGQKYNALPSENTAKQRNWLFISHICLFIIYLLAFTVAATLNLQNEVEVGLIYCKQPPPEGFLTY